MTRGTLGLALLLCFPTESSCSRTNSQSTPGADVSAEVKPNNADAPAPAPLSEEEARERHNALFTDGAKLVKPFFILSDTVASDPKTAKGKEDLQTGIAMLQQALKMNPENWSALWLVGKAQEALGDDAAAYRSMEAAYRLNDSHPDVIREFVIMALHLGKGQEAVNAARHAVDIAPDDHGARANLGLALLVHGEVDEALEVTESALRAEPTDEVTENLVEFIRDVKANKRPRPTHWPESTAE